MRSLARSLLMFVYSLLFVLVRPLVRLLSPLSPRLKQQAKGREDVPALAKRLAPIRAKHRHGVLFFCSSAGEYEQALPLIERLQASGTIYVQIVFFSRSGLDFVIARRDPVNACLAPLGDSAADWGWLMAALRPDIVAVVRHELWPGFLEAARHYGKVHLIAASQSIGESASQMKRFVRTRLLRSFDRIHAVSDADARFFLDTYGVDKDRITVAGDPKYDRVLERARKRQPETARLATEFARAGVFAHRLVAGSVHRPDVDALLAARTRLGKDAADWQLVLAPHLVTPEMTGWIRERCREAALSVVFATELANLGVGERRDVIVLDTMGQLAEAYGVGEAAYVGGALHHQVHNVLEPAGRGLALAYGPAYKNSQEAVTLVERGLAQVVTDGEDLSRWWGSLNWPVDGPLAKTDALRREVEAHAGATDRILADWRSTLQLP